MLAGGALSVALGAGTPPEDERAVEIALKALDAVESGWALARYDAASQVRAAVNLRGGGATPVGLTANLVIDRSAGRYRLDAAGDVGPLTLYVNGREAALHVPALGQYALRPAGVLAPGATVSRSLTAEVAAMRARLGQGYAELAYRGEESLDGRATHRIDDTPAPGVTASYWIDAASFLPRRIILTRPAGRKVAFDFHYGGGPRPTRIDVSLTGERDAQVVVTPSYEGGGGRVSRLHAVSRIASGGEFTADINLDWSPGVSAEHFRFTPPAGAREVAFEQLASGVLFAAAGKLGALLPLVTGWL